LKKVDENFPAIILIKNASRRGLHFLLQINYQKSDKSDRDRGVGFESQLFLEDERRHQCAYRHCSALA
jgi:hypothetical protein